MNGVVQTPACALRQCRTPAHDVPAIARDEPLPPRERPNCGERTKRLLAAPPLEHKSQADTRRCPAKYGRWHARGAERAKHPAQADPRATPWNRTTIAPTNTRTHAGRAQARLSSPTRENTDPRSCCPTPERGPRTRPHTVAPDPSMQRLEIRVQPDPGAREHTAEATG
jgi:hypothetical protein